MKTNVGMLDRIVRLAIAAAAFYVFFTGERPVWEYGALAVGVIMVLTALSGFCPLYRLAGFKTCKTSSLS
ncbi:MAG: DUF2892 domain-containing protein [Pseudomonadota bacterium]